MSYEDYGSEDLIDLLDYQFDSSMAGLNNLLDQVLSKKAQIINDTENKIQSNEHEHKEKQHERNSNQIIGIDSRRTRTFSDLRDIPRFYSEDVENDNKDFPIILQSAFPHSSYASYQHQNESPGRQTVHNDILQNSFKPSAAQSLSHNDNLHYDQKVIVSHLGTERNRFDKSEQLPPKFTNKRSKSQTETNEKYSSKIQNARPPLASHQRWASSYSQINPSNETKSRETSVTWSPELLLPVSKSNDIKLSIQLKNKYSSNEVSGQKKSERNANFDEQGTIEELEHSGSQAAMHTQKNLNFLDEMNPLDSLDQSKHETTQLRGENVLAERHNQRQNIEKIPNNKETTLSGSRIEGNKPKPRQKFINSSAGYYTPEGTQLSHSRYSGKAMKYIHLTILQENEDLYTPTKSRELSRNRMNRDVLPPLFEDNIVDYERSMEYINKYTTQELIESLDSFPSKREALLSSMKKTPRPPTVFSNKKGQGRDEEDPLDEIIVLKFPKKEQEEENLIQVYQQVSEVYEDGAKYLGEKLLGKRHGKGIYYFKEGYRYDGNWDQDQMSGFGILWLKDDLKWYEGEWANNLFHGKGSLYNLYPEELEQDKVYAEDFKKVEDGWVKYEGQFDSGLKNGFGSFYLTNGDFYIGNFRQNKAEGRGSYTKPNQLVIVGSWENNQLMETF